MSQGRRITYPPSSGDATLDGWLAQLADMLNSLPAFILVSGSPSGQTANAGTLAFNDSPSSASTQRLWINTSGTTSSWSVLTYA